VSSVGREWTLSGFSESGMVVGFVNILLIVSVFFSLDKMGEFGGRLIAGGVIFWAFSFLLFSNFQ